MQEEVGTRSISPTCGFADRDGSEIRRLLNRKNDHWMCDMVMCPARERKPVTKDIVKEKIASFDDSCAFPYLGYKAQIQAI